jgi:Phospholipase_D-nuclease N-terminal
MDFNVGGPLGLLVLILDVWAVVSVMQSGATQGSKVLWVVVIIVLPVLGFILWWLFGPKSG